MLTVHKLSFWYKKNRVILRDINFALGQGEILSLLGSNGTGKTTLLKILLSLLSATEGSVCLHGKKIKAISTGERAKWLAYVPQSADMAFPVTVREVVKMGRTAYVAHGQRFKKSDEDIINTAMDRLGIMPLADSLFNRLSGGERQMALMARALAQQARILILDEPTANLDYANQIKILKTIKELSQEGYSIIMTTHMPDQTFWIGGAVLLLKDGGILGYGQPQKILSGETLTTLYNTEVEVGTLDIPSSDGLIHTQTCIPIMSRKGEGEIEKAI